MDEAKCSRLSIPGKSDEQRADTKHRCRRGFKAIFSASMLCSVSCKAATFKSHLQESHRAHSNYSPAGPSVPGAQPMRGGLASERQAKGHRLGMRRCQWRPTQRAQRDSSGLQGVTGSVSAPGGIVG
jgi:hypothetical protein